jgi:hypothetical protein
MKDSTDSPDSASYLDNEGYLRSTLYEKRDYFKIPNLDSIPLICSKFPAFGVYVLQPHNYKSPIPVWVANIVQ